MPVHSESLILWLVFKIYLHSSTMTVVKIYLYKSSVKNYNKQEMAKTFSYPRFRCLSFWRLLIWVGSSSIWLLNMFSTSTFLRSAMFGGTAIREKNRESAKTMLKTQPWGPVNLIFIFTVWNHIPNINITNEHFWSKTSFY